MKATIGTEGLVRTWQATFPKETTCCKCKGIARIAFVAHEGMDEELKHEEYVCSLHKNDPPRMNEETAEGFWVHDCMAVAVYLCKDCLEPTAIANQA